MPAEELTRVSLSNQQKTNEMLTVVVKDVGGLDSKIAVLSTKLEEREAYRDWETDRKSTRLNSSHLKLSRMPSSA